MAIYLDYNATTPCDEEVVAAMLPYFTQKFGNASSTTHSFGWVADTAIEQSKSVVKQAFNLAPQDELIFTSGATESCNLALRGIYDSYKLFGNHIITIATEHKAVLDTCKALEKNGAKLTILPVNKDGVVDLELLKDAITDQTILIAAMYVNNETGVKQPIQEISQIASEKNIVFFCDATQAVGKLPIDVQALGIHVMALSAHKFYGPKGVGALSISKRRPRVKINAQITGGGQQGDYRSGTLNTPLIVGMAKAVELIDTVQFEQHCASLKKALIEGLSDIEGFKLNGTIENTVSNVVNFSIKGIKSQQVIKLLQHKVAFSVGSACNAIHNKPSHVLEAMQLDSEYLYGTFRFSFGKMTTLLEIQNVIEFFKEGIKILK